MLDYHTLGKLPKKHHIVFRSPEGKLYQEHCFTRAGFEKAYSILYHQSPPTTVRSTEVSPLDGSKFVPHALPNGELDFPRRRRHFISQRIQPGGDILASRTAIMYNKDITVSLARPTENSDDFFSNGDADELIFFFKGSGTVETMFGNLDFGELDYLLIPRATVHRYRFNPGEVHALIFEGHADIQIPAWFKNDFGQLKMDAPFCYRDFRLPQVMPWTEDKPTPASSDERGHKIVVKRKGRICNHWMEHYPLDVVGWDGWVYPLVFNINDYQAKAGLTHLPPTTHTTWASKSDPHGVGARYVICSFVPRMVDFHPQAIPCPYNHSSPDCDEILFYVKGNFTSRKGIGPGSISLHPTGIPHGPHPGTYEASIGHRETNEMAVMMDTFTPLELTHAGSDIEAKEYNESWAE